MPHGPEQLLLELFAIFVTAKVVGEIFEHLSLPAVPGEILAGMVLGPYALAWVPFNDTILNTIVVFMTAVTTLLAPPLLRYLFRTESKEHDERPTVARVQL